MGTVDRTGPIICPTIGVTRFRLPSSYLVTTGITVRKGWVGAGDVWTGTADKMVKVQLREFAFSASPSFICGAPDILAADSLTPAPRVDPVPGFRSGPDNLVANSVTLPVYPVCRFFYYSTALSWTSYYKWCPEGRVVVRTVVVVPPVFFECYTPFSRM